jgi:hypothetical protein
MVLVLAAFLASLSWSQAQNDILTHPINPVANTIGDWDRSSDTRLDQLGFTAADTGYNIYEECSGFELWHPQHVVRLANKDGRAYFMVAQSDEGGGFITLLQTNPGHLDPRTDLVTASESPRGHVGRYIWSDGYPDNGSNPIGQWNHPGKMDVVGGVLVVAAQNWSSNFVCGDDGLGSSPDAVLFYDVSDPEHPQYWGLIDEDDLGVNEISTVSLVRTPGGEYLLNAGGDGRFSTWVAREVRPDINNWSRIPTATGYTFTGQHGMNFNVSQDGIEQIMYFDSSGEDDSVSIRADTANSNAIPPLTTTQSWSFDVDLVGADRHWDSDSLYVTQFGMPVIYSMESDFGSDGLLFQLHNIRNLAGNIAPGVDPAEIDPRIALRASNGQYLVADGGGGGPIYADRSEIGPWELFSLIDRGGGQFALRTWSGHYVVAEGGGGQALNADRSEIGPWELFSLVDLGGGQVALRASNGQYIVAEGGGGGDMYANRDAVGPWETFTLIRFTAPGVARPFTDNVSASDSVAGLDFSAPPNFGSVQLAPGFTPDPHAVEILSGGVVDVFGTLAEDGCAGYATQAPDFSLEWTADGGSLLRILVVAEDDTTLIVNDPFGGWSCNDDTDSFNPMVEFQNPTSGRYDIWIGSYESTAFVEGTLYITELPIGPGDF